MLRKSSLLAFTLGLLWLSTSASASIVYTFSGVGVQQSGQNVTYGFDFTANQDILIDSLGFYDFGSDGLSSSHRVGIWDLGGSLLTSTTVTTGNSVLIGPDINGGQFRFTNIPVFSVASGTTLRFGAAIEAASDIWFAGQITNISASPALATVSSTGFFGPGNFVFPGQTISNTYGAGSFTARAASQVPVPATLGLLGLGLLALKMRRKAWSRRKTGKNL